MSNKIKETLIKKGLPLIANLITGDTANKVIDLVKTITGINTNTPEELEREINRNPELLIRLKELELTHSVVLEKLALQNIQQQLEETKVILSDKENARKREIVMAQSLGKSDWLMNTLAAIVVLVFFSLIILMILGPNSMTANGPINQLFGALVAGFSMVLSYYFGSSKSSSDKNKSLFNPTTFKKFC
ncbi:MAG: hypothetical protein JW717_10740 [Marinilabiliaceae bacterium]|nr:hypothetical protein [Marinilabiliaceae bacterium]